MKKDDLYYANKALEMIRDNKTSSNNHKTDGPSKGPSSGDPKNDKNFNKKGSAK